MPANEQTWYNQKTLHVAFAAAGLALLASTIWMLVDDHNRPWKDYQRTMRQVDARYNDLKISELNTAAYEARLKELKAAVEDARRALSNSMVIDDFQRQASEMLAAGFLEDFSEAEFADAHNAQLKLLQEQGNSAKSAFKVEEKLVLATTNVLAGIRMPDDAADSDRAEKEAAVEQTRLDVKQLVDAIAPPKNSLELFDSFERTLGANVDKKRGKAEQRRLLQSFDELSAMLESLRPTLDSDRNSIAKLQAAVVNAEKEGFLAGDVIKDSKFDKFSNNILDSISIASKSLGQRIEAQKETIEAMQAIVNRAKFHEDNLLAEKKNLSSERDAARSMYELAVRDGLPEAEVNRRLEATHVMDGRVAEKDAALAEAKAARSSLQDKVNAIRLPSETAEVDLKKHREAIDRLHQANADRVGSGASGWLRLIPELPILEAFNSPLKIDQIWLPDLKINYNLSDVARFDRCRTCHQALTRTEPGTATTPAYPSRSTLEIIVTPKKPEKGEATLRSIYGMDVSPRGLINERDVTLVVFPQSPAAQAGLQTADVLKMVGGATISTPADAEKFLVDFAEAGWGKPIKITVERGLLHPFSAHPRLDLYGTDTSPHPFQTMGCTVCHDGQGSATAFQHAEHTPNTAEQERQWRLNHGWYPNHFWEFPQNPKRFLESGCLKCHHSVVELRPSERFPDPPAPKLMAGYDLIRENGCFGCHDINGFAGPNKTIGPDMRTEPDYHVWAAIFKQRVGPIAAKMHDPFDQAVAQESKLGLERDRLTAEKAGADEARAADIDEQLKKNETELTESVAARAAIQTPKDALDQMLQWADQVRRMPEDSTARRSLLAAIENDADESDGRAPLLDAETHAIARRLADVETPGTMRKVGPSLRHVASKIDDVFLHDWIAKPTHFRPTTRMPQPFGNHDHLKGPDGGETESLQLARRYEAAEIYSIAAYLLDKSQPFEFVEPPAGILPIENDDDREAQLERGRNLVVTRGCIACHSVHDEGRPESDEEADLAAIAFGKADQDQGPDLSRIGAKLARRGGELGARDPQKWLYSWLKDPSRYHTRTKMPQLFLDPEPVRDPAGKPLPRVDDQGNPLHDASGAEMIQMTDPAADIAAYLLSLSGAEPWEPVEPQVDAAAIEELAQMRLADKFRKRLVDEYLALGIPEAKRAELKGDEVELLVDRKPNVGDPSSDQLAALREQLKNEVDRKKLLYVGRRSIAKYGCAGCHDIPGFEDFKPIGTGLADWGRKGTDRLAFEQIARYHSAGGHGDAHTDDSQVNDHASAEIAAAAADNEPVDSAEAEERQEYFEHRLHHGDRDGFLWQKLKEPRSYDYQKTATKGYDEWLRMPKFNLTDEEIEQTMTFVLGLVAEPPIDKYQFNPGGDRGAIVAGRAVLEKFNCAGCHVLNAERLELNLPPGYFNQPDALNDFAFLHQSLSASEVADSKAVDRRGSQRVTLYGMPALLDDEPRTYQLEDPDDPSSVFEPDPDEPYNGPLYQPFVLMRNAVIDGSVFYVGQRPPIVPETMIADRYPAFGGYAARWMMPVIFDQIKPVKQNLTGMGTWALVPPPLLGQGNKVQTGWMHDFLLDPYPIRPAVVLRMPKFNMSSDEAAKLVAYFAAVDHAEHPYSFDRKTRDDYLAKVSQSRADHLGDAMKIVTKVCSECHRIGDFSPQGQLAAMAPNLDMAHQRLRPDFLRRWIANPKSVLPYTEMPVNFNHDQVKYQEMYPGATTEQLEAVIDLLLNYDRYMKSQIPVSEMVRRAKASAGAAPTGENNVEAGN